MRRIAVGCAALLLAMPVQAQEAGTALPAGDDPAPAPPVDHAADAIYDPAEMARARAIVRAEHGGGSFSQLMFNLAEYRVRKGRDGYHWEGEGWFGGDFDRIVLKTRGEGAIGRRFDHGEAQALYARALDPYWNLQAGVRYDFGGGRSTPYAAIGVEGLAPYWFEVSGALFVSDKGDLIGRIEGYHDMRLTRRLILQPRAELDFAAQDAPRDGIGSGLSQIELGLRLRYEIARECAPYVGVSHDRAFGDTADFARAAGEGAKATSFVAGIRFWF